uniref:Uncharacterized protein n=1 Tax=Anoplophora glabripennis TaxID=217634 RepID=V5IAM9_ANOGL
MIRVRMEYILIAVAVFAAAVASGIESNFYYDESCSKAEGNCVLEKECPHPVDNHYKSLCPGQKDAVCCKHFPREKLNCFQLHNECQESCPEQLDLGRKGCQKGTCCVLI